MDFLAAQALPGPGSVTTCVIQPHGSAPLAAAPAGKANDSAPRDVTCCARDGGMRNGATAARGSPPAFAAGSHHR